MQLWALERLPLDGTHFTNSLTHFTKFTQGKSVEKLDLQRLANYKEIYTTVSIKN